MTHADPAPGAAIGPQEGMTTTGGTTAPRADSVAPAEVEVITPTRMEIAAELSPAESCVMLPENPTEPWADDPSPEDFEAPTPEIVTEPVPAECSPDSVEETEAENVVAPEAAECSPEEA